MAAFPVQAGKKRCIYRAGTRTGPVEDWTGEGGEVLRSMEEGALHKRNR